MNSIGDIKPRRFNPSTNTLVFVVCLLLAIFFWLLNVFGKTYTTVIYIPVNYINMPYDKVAMNILPDSFAVRAEVSGYALFTGNAGEKNDTIIIDGYNFRSIKRRDKNLSFFHVRPMLNEMATKNYSSFRIAEILIDTLFVEFEKKSTKVLMIDPKYELDVAHQYEFSGTIDMLPEAIKVSGPKSILDTMNSIPTNFVKFDNVSDNLTTSFSFYLANDKRFELSPQKALATFRVNKITESKLEIPISTLNVPKNVVLKTFPNKVEITYLVALEHFESVSIENFELTVDYNDVVYNEPKLEVTVSKFPKFVTITNIEPSRLEYIIKK